MKRKKKPKYNIYIRYFTFEKDKRIKSMKKLFTSCSYQ